MKSGEVFGNRLIAEPFTEPRRLGSRDILRLLPQAWPFIRPLQGHLVRLFVLLLPAAASGLFGLMLVRIFFDVIGNGSPLTPYEAWLLRLPLHATRQAVLARTCLAGGFAVLLSLPYLLFLAAYAVWILQEISNLYRLNLYDKLQELSLRFHSEEKIGDAIFRMFQDSAGIPQVINGLLIRPLRAVVVAAINLGWLAVFDYQMALIALVLIPAEFALAWAFGASLRTAFLDAREASALAITRIEETLASIKAVKAFGREDHEAAVYAEENWAALMTERKARMRLLVYHVGSNLIRAIAYVAVIYIGAWQVVRGHGGGLATTALSLGLFQGTLIAFGRIGADSHHLARLWGSLQDVAVGLARVFQILGKQGERLAGVRVRARGQLRASLRQAVAFDRVCFAYRPGIAVLDGLDFTAQVGELTAVVGPSGAGKSTLIALLLRFFDPTGGRILLDGSDIREFDLALWRQMIAVGLQNNPLLAATLADNVAYGRPDASAREIRAALERAGLGEFLEALPAGLNTMLGERGTRLSAGQAQRIGVARALLRDAPILLLDEPSSALDIANEERLMRGVRAWLAERPTGRLAIMTTHRRTAAAWADRVYRLAYGRLEPAQSRGKAAANA